MGLHDGQAVAARSGRGMGADVPARAEPGPHRCPRARPARRCRIPPGHRPTPGPGAGGRTPGRGQRHTCSPAPPPGTLPGWKRSPPGSWPRADCRRAVPQTGMKGPSRGNGAPPRSSRRHPGTGLQRARCLQGSMPSAGATRHRSTTRGSLTGSSSLHGSKRPQCRRQPGEGPPLPSDTAHRSRSGKPPG